VSDSPVLFMGRRFFASGSSSRLASFISLLAMTGLVLGVALLIVVLSVMNGFDREMRTRILGLVPHIQLFQAGGVDDWRALQRELLGVPGIEEATPFTRFSAMISFRGTIEAAEIQGLDPGHLDSQLQSILPPELMTDLEGDGLLMSEALASRLKVSAGDRLTLIVPRTGADGQPLSPRAQGMRVAGIFNTHTAEDNGLAIVNLASAGQISGFDHRPQALRIRLSDVFQARDMGYQLIRNLPPQFSFIDWFQTHGNLYQAIQLSRQMVGLLIFLIIAIAVFNVVSMMVMTVVDKKGAIAILKTQGATNATVLGVFLVQGSLIGLWGCFLGVAIGVPVALYAPSLVAGLEALLGMRFLNSEIYPIDYLPTDLQVRDVLMVVGVALALNFVATLYPAWRAARVRPAEVLRYE